MATPSKIIPFARHRSYFSRPRFRSLLLSGLLLAGGLGLHAAETPPAASTSSKIVSAVPELTALPTYFPWATVVLDDGTVGTIDKRQFKFSDDDGKTFHEAVDLPRPADGKGAPQNGPLLKTAEGTLVLVYDDAATRNLSWDRTTGEPKPDQRADVWTARSTDGGRTWTDRQEISALFHDVSPYCLSLIQLTQAPDGTLVVPLQLRVGNHNRSILTTAISRDDGKTWQPSQSILDIGGAGVHDGLLEPTLVGLRDGRVWMLIRTNLDQFYESFSSDSGLTWSTPVPSGIGASSAPGYLLRLKSGRLLLLWNRLLPEGRTDYPRRSGLGYSKRPASWHRDELSLAFSSDEGRTWSEPKVILRGEGLVSYPSAFERRDGEIWISLNHKSHRSFRFLEADFVDAPAKTQ
jgi:sialidase-1